MQEKRVHLYISGRVQGVFYRAYVREKAQELEVSGWAKNLYDGRVEVIAEGLEESLKALIEWCHEGSPMARVSSVDVKWEEPTGEFSSFGVRR